MTSTITTPVRTERRQNSATPDLRRDATVYYSGFGFSGSLPFGGRFGNGRGIYSDDAKTAREFPEGADAGVSTLAGIIALCQGLFARQRAWEERTIREYGGFTIGLDATTERMTELTDRRVFLSIGPVYGGSTVRVDNLADNPEAIKALATAAFAARV
jgi:hypothetical protein